MQFVVDTETFDALTFGPLTVDQRDSGFYCLWGLSILFISEEIIWVGDQPSMCAKISYKLHKKFDFKYLLFNINEVFVF